MAYPCCFSEHLNIGRFGYLADPFDDFSLVTAFGGKRTFKLLKIAILYDRFRPKAVIGVAGN
jgi:hypothetical protein